MDAICGITRSCNSDSNSAGVSTMLHSVAFLMYWKFLSLIETSISGWSSIFSFHLCAACAKRTVTYNSNLCMSVSNLGSSNDLPMSLSHLKFNFRNARKRRKKSLSSPVAALKKPLCQLRIAVRSLAKSRCHISQTSRKKGENHGEPSTR
jgi:hypothetical protein